MEYKSKRAECRRSETSLNKENNVDRNNFNVSPTGKRHGFEDSLSPHRANRFESDKS